MSAKLKSLITYFVVFVILMGILAIISPSQFEALIGIFSESANLFLVVIFIAVLAFVLRSLERL